MNDLETRSRFRLHPTGAELLQAMRAAIGQARHSVRFEFYTVTDSRVGREFRDALVAAAARGVRVQALVDAVGSFELGRSFFSSLERAGGEFRWFNPLRLSSWTFRDHRKTLVVDDRTGFVGGINLDDAYDGDGAGMGWRDLGIEVQGPLVRELALAHDEMFEHASLRTWSFHRGEGSRADAAEPGVELLAIKPALGGNPLRRALSADLRRARDIVLVSPYFLPSPRLRLSMYRACRRGARIRLLLPGRSDVPVAQMAARSLYRRLLRRGIEIYEYQPQILHAKLMLFDDTVYVGSSNIDPRSLAINFEIVVRSQDPALAAEARAMLEGDWKHSTQVMRERWNADRSWWQRMQGRLAWWLLARADLTLARTKLRRLR